VDAGQYRRQQDQALRPLVQVIRVLFYTFGVPVTEAQVAVLAQQAYRHVSAARDLIYGITLRYLVSQHLSEGIVVPAAREYPLAAVSTTIADTTSKLVVNGDPVTEANRADIRVIEAARTAVTGPLNRQAQEPARETVAGIGEDTSNGYGWARMLVGAYSCAFCAMLASRGPVYSSRAAALGRGGNPLDLYHSAHIGKNGKMVGGNCDCVAVLVPRGSTTWEGHQSHQKLDNLWQDSTEGFSGPDALNAFRRDWGAKVRAGESHQYLADSVKPKPAAA
jgi:hypothetical protein